ncbi:MAG: endonuclease [Ilumatobacteraceae bacterium]|nr:endonuclease [Ilumatobacteraceae bacterium]
MQMHTLVVPAMRRCRCRWRCWRPSSVGGLRTAYEKVRVAAALERLPTLWAAMADGSLSYAKARALTRIANEANVADLLQIALVSTSNQVERIVTGYLRHEPDADDAEARAHRDRQVTVRNEGSVGVITIRVPIETAAVLIGCMERFIACTESDDPASVPRTTARRILCDCVMQGYRTDDGVENDWRLGANRRTVSRRLKRALRLRDHGCRFPGCTHQAWLDAHHIVHWLDHGPTVEQNLVCLCRRHHRLLHEGGWSISGDPNGELWFHQPDGTIVPGQPARRHGDASDVAASGRTADDGRCGWWGDPLDLDYTLDVIIGNEYGDPDRWIRQRREMVYR